VRSVVAGESWWDGHTCTAVRVSRCPIVPLTLDRATRIISRSSIKSSSSEHSRVCRELHLLFPGEWCEVEFVVFNCSSHLLIMAFID
jgi:hypothetical protein